MIDYTGCVVRANAGRDRGGLFLVTGMEPGGTRLLLADGKRRRVARPKAKQRGHITVLAGLDHPYEHAAVSKLQQGTPVSDRELRRALAAFEEENTLGER